MQLSTLDILKKVVETLASKPRSVTKDCSGWPPTKCRYTSLVAGQTCHCAVGMFMLPEYQTVEFEFNTASLMELERQGAHLDDYLIPEARGHRMAFWRELQYLHDEEELWTARHNDQPGQVLTRPGMIEFDAILEKFCTKEEFKANHLVKD